MSRTIALLILGSVALASPRGSSWAAVIDAGAHNLQPNMPGQKIDFFVTGGEKIIAVVFSVAIDGGGPAYGGILGPSITNLDLVSLGHIFSPNHGTVYNDYSDPQLWESNTITAVGTIPATGLLATITVDTTGFGPGEHTLDLKGQPLTDYPGDTQLLFADTLITNGSITIVPEPSSVALAAIGLMGLTVWGCRRRKS
jgi:hypothetical protein